METGVADGPKLVQVADNGGQVTVPCELQLPDKASVMFDADGKVIAAIVVQEDSVHRLQYAYVPDNFDDWPETDRGVVKDYIERHMQPGQRWALVYRKSTWFRYLLSAQGD
jgi:hypothetical protein